MPYRGAAEEPRHSKPGRRLPREAGQQPDQVVAPPQGPQQSGSSMPTPAERAAAYAAEQAQEEEEAKKAAASPPKPGRHAQAVLSRPRHTEGDLKRLAHRFSDLRSCVFNASIALTNAASRLDFLA